MHCCCAPCFTYIENDIKINGIKNEDGMTLDVSNAKTRVNIVDIDWIFPLSWDNTGITECAFGSVKYIGGQKYVVLSVHKLNDKGNYVIYNHLFI